MVLADNTAAQHAAKDVQRGLASAAAQQSASPVAGEPDGDDALLRRQLIRVRSVGWESRDGTELLRILDRKCRLWAPAVDRYCGLPAGTTDPCLLLSTVWEVLDRSSDRVIEAANAWPYLWHAVRNAAAVEATAAALQTAALPARSMRACRTLQAPVRLGLDHDVETRTIPQETAYGPGTTDRWSPALRALLDILVARGGDRTYWADALDRAVDVIADARRSYEEHQLHRDPHLRLVLALRPEQLTALGALLIGTRRGNRASQSLLLALHRDPSVDPATVPGSDHRLGRLLPDTQITARYTGPRRAVRGALGNTEHVGRHDRSVEPGRRSP